MFRVKICGVTCPEDATMCAEAGADAIGLNFYPASPRWVDVATAKRISAALPAAVAKVGVFVNPPVDQVAAVFDEVGLDFAQLHGDEPPEFLLGLKGRPVIKAFRCRSHGGDVVLDFLAGCRTLDVQPAAVLIDAFVPGSYGGTGVAVDWPFVAELGSRTGETSVVLAGGLVRENVAQAIRVARPAAVDTASGVELSPGVKDALLCQDFVRNARLAFDRAGRST